MSHDHDESRPSNAYERRLAQRRARLERAAERASDESQRAYGRARAATEHIPPGQPIIVGHYSEGRHRAALRRHDRAMGKSIAEARRAEELAQRAAAVGTGGISSDDPAAVAKLQAELDAATAAHATMVQANKLIRAGKSAELVSLGLSEATISELLNPRFGGKPGFPAYRLSNSNANIKRIEGRIKELAARPAREAAFTPVAGDGWRLYAEDNRICIAYDERQSAEVVQNLKRRGFKWSPSRNAWVRQFNANGVYAARSVLDLL